MKTVSDFIPKLYNYVPPCPACQSKKTGYYMKSYFSNEDWSEQEALKHGEIVKQVPEVPKHNLFCEDCGFEWQGTVETIVISKRRRMQEIEDRGLFKKIVDFKNEITQERKKAPLHKKIARKFGF